MNRDDFRQIYSIGLPCDNKENVISAIRELETVSGVKYAGPNYRYEPQSTAAVAATYANENFVNQWGLSRIQAKEAWDSIKNQSLTSVKVGIIDSGISEHAVFGNNLAAGRHFYRDPNNSAQVNQDSQTQDTNGHGTLVAGLVSAVCPNVTLVPLKIGDYWGNEVAAAVNYAIVNNIGVLNFSGGTEKDPTILKSVLNNYSGLFIAAAGNDGNHNLACYPAEYMLPNIISVGGTKENSDYRAEAADWPGQGGSNYGQNVTHLFAPGVFSI